MIVWGDGYILKIELIGFFDEEDIKCNERERERKNLKGKNIEFFFWIIFGV